MLEHRITYVVCGAGNQTLDGEVPASFFGLLVYNNRRYRIKQSDKKCIRIIYAVPSFNLKNFRVIGSG